MPGPHSPHSPPELPPEELRRPPTESIAQSPLPPPDKPDEEEEDEDEDE